jgi:RNA polymerase sigma factor (TIGR02999 family)
MSVEVNDKLTKEAPDAVRAATDRGQQNQPPKEALDDLFAGIYQELRVLAYAIKRNHANATLNPTALVDEVYLRMVHSPNVALLPRLHFKRIAGRAMRQVLIDSARNRLAQKRGGVDRPFVMTVGDSAAEQIPCDERLLALHDALDELSRINVRQSAIVEHRFFGGMTEPDISLLLGISPATVQREWRVARAWLNRRLG